MNKALDFVIKAGLKLAGPVIRGLKGIGSRVKKKVAAGKAWVKGKAEAGKQWVKGKAEAGKQWVKGKADSVRGPRAARDERAGPAAAEAVAPTRKSTSPDLCPCPGRVMSSEQ